MARCFQAMELFEFCSLVFQKLGVCEADARLLADTLVMADLWGHQSHGVLRLPWYANRLRSGVMSAKTEALICADFQAIRRLDGRDGIGQVLTHQAMKTAIERASAFGIGAVSVANSNHFGTAMYFTRTAAENGMIGFLSTNASPSLAPFGGREKRLGNNPWSIAAPRRDAPPLVLDIANSAVARGKLYLAEKRGEPIPEDWALDAMGQPTTDPRAGIEGIIQPMARHKGYAISAMMDVLSGILSASQFATGVTGPYQAEKPGRCGHLAIAINIAAFRDMNEFFDDLNAWAEILVSTPRSKGVDRIYLPGEIEAEYEERQRLDGIALPKDTIEALRVLGREFGIQSEVTNGSMA